MTRGSSRSSRPLAWLLTVSVMLALTSCETSDIADPESVGDAIVTLRTPGSEVSAALVELTGVAEVILTDGTALGRMDGNTLRVIVLLNEPGELDFGVRLHSGVVEPTGTLISVVDGRDVPIESLDGYRLEFSR